jgi:hypothetical protein
VLDTGGWMQLQQQASCKPNAPSEELGPPSAGNPSYRGDLTAPCPSLDTHACNALHNWCVYFLGAGLVCRSPRDVWSLPSSSSVESTALR